MIQAAIARDLSSMLQPRSIALIGATDRSTWSKATFTNLTTRKYGGQVHLIARRGGTVHGRQAADLDVVAAAIARIGDAALALGDRLDELDVNPLWVRGTHVEALDGLAVARK
jgi:hypothetical protein